MDALEQKTHYSKINRALLKLDESPLLRTYAPFDFVSFANILKKSFSIKDLKVELVSTKWVEKEEIATGFSNLNYLSFVFTPLEGSAYLLMDTEDISKLTNEMLSEKKQVEFSSSILKESYYRYISLRVLNILNEINLFQDLSPKIVNDTSPLEEPALCLDFKIKINGISVFARIALTNKFRGAWEEYFISNPPLKATELSRSLELTMTARIGEVTLNYQDLKKVQNGDFVILDKINYDLKNNKGDVILNLGPTSIFLAKIKQNTLKILDFASYLEEGKSMEESNVEEEKKQPIAEDLAAEIKEEEPSEFPTKSLQEMPITIVVEAARFKITLDKLMNTQPGNILDLAIHPQKGVDLTVNGEKIARAELVQIGENLGVRIIEMG